MTSGLYNYKNCCYSVYKQFKRFLQIYLWLPQMTFDNQKQKDTSSQQDKSIH